MRQKYQYSTDCNKNNSKSADHAQQNEKQLYFHFERGPHVVVPCQLSPTAKYDEDA